MRKKLLICIVAVIGIIAMVLTGCAGAGGKQPVTIKMLIRNNDQRLEIGDYVGNQLEDLGFTVTRQYGVGSDLGPIWQGDPDLGLWNVYTAAWISTAVSRDEGSNFAFFYTPLGGGGPLWDAYTPTEEFLDVATPLWWNSFSTMPEREDLFEAAVPMSMEDSARVFLDDRTSFAPLQANVAVAADAYGGIEGSWLWGPTIHFKDGADTPLLPAWDGGVNGTLTMRVALEDLLVQPWNGVAGSNWAFDQNPIRATCENGFEYDTRDGLAWPGVAEKAEVVVLEGLPVGQTETSEGWLTLTTSEDLIPVPTTAWADWDAVAQNWTLVAPDTTAKTKTVVYYPTGTFGRPLHDGSTLSAGDFMLYAILAFDRAKEDSAIYDPNYVATFDAFMEHFKGVEFDFDQEGYDLVVTTYDDLVYMDAELIARGNSWFPTGPIVGGNNLGPWIWHNLALGILAEQNGELAFSQSKATSEDVEWLSFISGPSLDILAGHLADVQNSEDPDYRFLPYSDVLSDYIDTTEIDERYGNLQDFYDTYEHFWVASGPLFLYDVDTTGKKLELDAFTAYPEDGSKWLFLVDSDGKEEGQQVPVSPPEHDGAWVDKVTLEIETHENAVSRLQSNDLDVYAAGLADPDLFDTVDADPDLHYYMNAGLFDELTFNPSGPFFPDTGKLNPFSIPAVREAMNWAVDRAYITGEIYGGMAFERYTCVGTQTGDYINRYPALLAATEADYAYDFDAADAAIEAAMLAINGTTREDGKYYYTPP